MLMSIPARGIRLVLVTAGVHHALQHLFPDRARTHTTGLILSD